MHAVNIGICSNDYLIVTQRIETILYVKGRLQQVEFFVFIDHFLCKPEAVEWLSTQRKYGLGVHIAALCDASAGRIALGYEDTALLLAVALRVTEVHTTVAKFPIMKVCLLGSLASELRYASHCFAFALSLLDFILKNVSKVLLMNVQEIVNVGLNEVAHELIDGLSVR